MTPRRLISEALLLPLGVLGAAVVLRWVHGEWDLRRALLVGTTGPLLGRWIVRRGVRAFPPFLLRILDTMGGAMGLLLACWSTMLGHSFPYWILKWQEQAMLAGGSILLGGGLVSLVYTHGRMAREIEDREAGLAALREAALQARLRALTAQINPHFLFNALNVLAELAHEDAAATERLVTDLAWLLRYTLKSSAEGTVPLGQELEAIERYLRIEQARLGDRLIVEIDVPEDLLLAEIPGLTLQPLVENAVKYAASSQSGPAVVSIDADALPPRDGEPGSGLLRIWVEDNGPGLPQDVRASLESSALPTVDAAQSGARGTGGAGGGLANVQQRLALAFRGAARVVAEDTEQGCRLRLEVPR